ncbi:hypothetical protein EAH80_04305 [Mycobacterium hodleri]|uniref:Uncharacterized protein n=1 Tax=Mycolicibacterium hodleri TaxID=49897 RepID=A0A502EHY2_9MYCO|nr:hypothetical protein EAH80_04305 [Mycolicibacterium hodleri]
MAELEAKPELDQRERQRYADLQALRGREMQDRYRTEFQKETYRAEVQRNIWEGQLALAGEDPRG